MKSILDPTFRYSAKANDYTGKRFGRLVCVERLPSRVQPSGQKKSMWKVLCDCGNTAEIRGADLASGNTTSCGCFAKESAGKSNKTHGLSKIHPLFYLWCDMRSRCNSPKDPAYSRYGGRGITVCERWSSFENFIADMGDRPAGYQLERVNNDLGYSPDNCTWATREAQCRNRRSNIKVTINGETLCLLDWCKKVSLPYARVRARIKKLNWSPERALGLQSRS